MTKPDVNGLACGQLRKCALLTPTFVNHNSTKAQCFSCAENGRRIKKASVYV